MASSVEAAPARRPAVVAGAIGNFIEWYDFGVYGYLATVIATLFFPSEDRTAALLATFAVFAGGFVMRPLGAIIFGHYGDKIGRRNTLSAVVVLMGVSTFAIGALPTYAQVGVLGPILLVFFRLLQGLSAGGEWGGAAAFLVEHAPPSRRGLYGSWQQFTVVAGLLGGALSAFFLTSVLSPEALNSWGWRIPFLLGLLLAVLGLYLRLRVEETPRFRSVEEAREVARTPLLETLRRHWKESLLVMGIELLPIVAFYGVLVYLPTYLTETFELSSSSSLLATVIGLSATIVLIPVTGALSDRVGRKPFLISASIGFVVLTYPAFMLLSQGGFLLAAIVLVGFGLMYATFAGVTPAALCELFPTKVRYSALSVPYNIATATFGGTAPFVATYLISRTGNDLAPALYVIAGSVITLFVVIAIKETYAEPLDDT